MDDMVREGVGWGSKAHLFVYEILFSGAGETKVIFHRITFKR
jgi:hypothetical protein